MEKELQKDPLLREEELFRMKKEAFYREVPEALDQKILAYSRNELAGNRFAFRKFPMGIRAAAVVLILLLPLAAVFLMESDEESPAAPRGKISVNVPKNNIPAYRMDMAELELYQLNNELEVVQNLLGYSPREKQGNTVSF